jgi:hypothetical protein
MRGSILGPRQAKLQHHAAPCDRNGVVRAAAPLLLHVLADRVAGDMHRLGSFPGITCTFRRRVEAER